MRHSSQPTDIIIADTRTEVTNTHLPISLNIGGSPVRISSVLQRPTGHDTGLASMYGHTVSRPLDKACARIPAMFFMREWGGSFATFGENIKDPRNVHATRINNIRHLHMRGPRSAHVGGGLGESDPVRLRSFYPPLNPTYQKQRRIYVN